MTESERLAIAAHLHVLLRRKTGRVTDTEWMACNAEYAAEIVRYARTKAVEDGHPELAEWAGKLEDAMAQAQAKPERKPLLQASASPAVAVPPPELPKPAVEQPAVSSGFGHSRNGESIFGEESVRRRDPSAPRYVGGLR